MVAQQMPTRRVMKHLTLVAVGDSDLPLIMVDALVAARYDLAIAAMQHGVVVVRLEAEKQAREWEWGKRRLLHRA
jgi:hypothetical protein